MNCTTLSLVWQVFLTDYSKFRNGCKANTGIKEDQTRSRVQHNIVNVVAAGMTIIKVLAHNIKIHNLDRGQFKLDRFSNLGSGMVNRQKFENVWLYGVILCESFCCSSFQIFSYSWIHKNPPTLCTDAEAKVEKDLNIISRYKSSCLPVRYLCSSVANRTADAQRVRAVIRSAWRSSKEIPEQ